MRDACSSDGARDGFDGRKDGVDQLGEVPSGRRVLALLRQQPARQRHAVGVDRSGHPRSTKGLRKRSKLSSKRFKMIHKQRSPGLGTSGNFAQGQGLTDGQSSLT